MSHRSGLGSDERMQTGSRQDWCPRGQGQSWPPAAGVACSRTGPTPRCPVLCCGACSLRQLLLLRRRLKSDTSQRGASSLAHLWGNSLGSPRPKPAHLHETVTWGLVSEVAPSGSVSGCLLLERAWPSVCLGGVGPGSRAPPPIAERALVLATLGRVRRRPRRSGDQRTLQ